MSLFHFHTTSIEDFFHIIGSADRDALRAIGVNLGKEYRPITDDEDDELYEEETTEEPEEWNVEGEEQQAAIEVLTQMIMTGIPSDLAEDQAYAIQDFFASYALHNDDVHLLDYEDIQQHVAGRKDDDDFNTLMAEGLHGEDFANLIEWLAAREAPDHLRNTLQMIALGRIPETDEPTFTDLEDEAYLPRFSYLTQIETKNLAKELEPFAKQAAKDLGPSIRLLQAVIRHAAQAKHDLVVTIED